MKCPKVAYQVCLEWTLYHKNASIFISEVLAELNYAIGKFLSQNSEPLMCRLEDGVLFSSGLTMIMFHGEKLMRRVTEIIDRLVEAGMYSQWNSKHIVYLKLFSRKIVIVHHLDEYYSFNLYHMQPAFYLISWAGV